MSEPTGPTKRGRSAAEKLRRLIISIFFVAAIVNMFSANFGWNWKLYQKEPSQGALESSARRAWWLTRQLGSVIGADNSWRMFSTLHKNSWVFVYSSIDAQGRITDLPLPFQSARDPVDQYVFDAIMPKFYLNLYGSTYYRAAYGRYLCARFAKGPMPAPRRIDLLVQFRTIPSPPWRAPGPGETKGEVKFAQRWESTVCAL